MRSLKSEEIPLVKFMIQKAGLEIEVSDLKLESMDDGGMGSLHFFTETKEPKFGKTVSEYEFKDQDGLPVFATLILDQNDRIYELDMWKVDYSPLQKWPKPQPSPSAI